MGFGKFIAPEHKVRAAELIGLDAKRDHERGAERKRIMHSRGKPFRGWATTSGAKQFLPDDFGVSNG